MAWIFELVQGRVWLAMYATHTIRPSNPTSSGWCADGETVMGRAAIRHFTDSPVLKEKGRHRRIMTPEWNGIERRLERLKGCLLKL
ncbi:hypothetical protein KAW44_00230 [Candidatus Bipolaricaulota bacterium]|nr:hypothetical protein [Candidatus Bipolaricaulota bacterium]